MASKGERVYFLVVSQDQWTAYNPNAPETHQLAMNEAIQLKTKFGQDLVSEPTTVLAGRIKRFNRKIDHRRTKAKIRGTDHFLYNQLVREFANLKDVVVVEFEYISQVGVRVKDLLEWNFHVMVDEFGCDREWDFDPNWLRADHVPEVRQGFGICCWLFVQCKMLKESVKYAHWQLSKNGAKKCLSE